MRSETFRTRYPTARAARPPARGAAGFTLIELPFDPSTLLGVALRHSKGDRLRVRKKKSAAFTLIELLVVLFILSILVSLAVSVGWIIVDKAKAKETAGIQAIVMDAIQAYYDDKDRHEYPTGNASSMLTALKANPAARDKLRNLPAKALSDADNAVRDAYGEEMVYQKTGGLGGTTPVLISKGPDRQLYTGDDIRSDGSKE